MDGKGWKAEYGMTSEGKLILGFVEALPKLAREELLTTIELYCRSQGYVSLDDNFLAKRDEAQESEPSPTTGGKLAQVIPILRGGRKLG